jgi:hypothetical protein
MPSGPVFATMASRMLDRVAEDDSVEQGGLADARRSFDEQRATLTGGRASQSLTHYSQFLRAFVHGGAFVHGALAANATPCRRLAPFR